MSYFKTAVFTCLPLLAACDDANFEHPLDWSTRAAETRLAWVDGLDPVRTAACGPFKVEIFATDTLLDDPPSRHAWQEGYGPSNEKEYFSGIAVRITKPKGLDATGLEYLFVPAMHPDFVIARRADWYDPARGWTDVRLPFAYLAVDGDLDFRIFWARIGNEPNTAAARKAGAPYETFWRDQFVYGLPYSDVTEHLSRYAEPGDRFRLIEPHPAQLRWKGEVCTVPVPDVEFVMIGDKDEAAD